MSVFDDPLVELFLIGIFFAVPLSVMFRKAGRSPWWGVLAFVPMGVLIGIAMLAYGHWPALTGASAASSQVRKEPTL